MSIQEVKERIDQERVLFKIYLHESLQQLRDRRQRLDDPLWREKVLQAKGEFLKENFQEETLYDS